MCPVKPTEKEEEYFARLELEKKKKIAEEQRAKLSKDEKKRLKELHYMHCPKCGSDLVEIKFKKVPVDKCPECDGVWLDYGELEQVITSVAPFIEGLLKVFKK
jgi:uncharacterized protein